MKTRLTLLEWKVLQWMATPYIPGHDAAYPSVSVDQTGGIWIHPDNRRDLTTAAKKAAVSFIARGWTDADDHKNHRLNAEGMKAAKEIPKPEWKLPPKPKLVKRDFDVLNELESASRNHEQKHVHDRWATTMYCGGSNGSHHAASLTKLVRHGYAEILKWQDRKEVTVTGDAVVPEPRLHKRAKGSRRFRVTDAGIDALEQWRASLSTRR